VSDALVIRSAWADRIAMSPMSLRDQHHVGRDGDRLNQADLGDVARIPRMLG
jgi:hypothetical protein